MKIRIATFNTENLFARYNFREGKTSLATNGFTINDLAFTLYGGSSKKITAQAIKEVNTDIICLQEVENISVLERFNSGSDLPPLIVPLAKLESTTIVSGAGGL